MRIRKFRHEFPETKTTLGRDSFPGIPGFGTGLSSYVIAAGMFLNNLPNMTLFRFVVVRFLAQQAVADPVERERQTGRINWFSYPPIEFSPRIQEKAWDSENYFYQ